MALFKRRKKETTPDHLKALADELVEDLNTNKVPDNHPRFWLDHGFMDGDQVECAACGTPLVVRLIKYSRVILATTDAHTGAPLICGDCGRLLCLDCALQRHPHRPSCDRCQRVGGVTSLMK